MIPTLAYVLLGLGLFTIGVIGILVRRNIIFILMSVELILSAAGINLVAFSQRLQARDGRVFAAFIILDAVAAAAVGSGLILASFRNEETLNADEIDLLKW